MLTRLLLRGLHPVGIAFLILEMQRVGRGCRDLHLGKDAPVEQRLEPLTRADVHVVAAVSADV